MSELNSWFVDHNWMISFNWECFIELGEEPLYNVGMLEMLKWTQGEGGLCYIIHWVTDRHRWLYLLNIFYMVFMKVLYNFQHGILLKSVTGIVNRWCGGCLSNVRYWLKSEVFPGVCNKLSDKSAFHQAVNSISNS